MDKFVGVIPNWETADLDDVFSMEVSRKAKGYTELDDAVYISSEAIKELQSRKSGGVAIDTGSAVKMVCVAVANTLAHGAYMIGGDHTISRVGRLALFCFNSDLSRGLMQLGGLQAVVVCPSGEIYAFSDTDTTKSQVYCYVNQLGDIEQRPYSNRAELWSKFGSRGVLHGAYSPKVAPWVLTPGARGQMYLWSSGALCLCAPGTELMDVIPGYSVSDIRPEIEPLYPR